MSWMPREEWERLKTGEGCVICADCHLEENPFSFKVAELDWSFVRLSKNQHRRGWTVVTLKRHATVVTLKRHANELWELGDEELAGYWREVARVARALDRIYRPAKINYGVFGNLCPHIHCHLLVQTYADDPRNAINMNDEQVLLSVGEYEAMIETLRREIVGT